MGGRTSRGQKYLDMSQWGGAKKFGQTVKGGDIFWTSRQGGAKNFGLGQYFLKSLKSDFLCFWGVLGTFNFWVQGGAKNFGRVVRGGRTKSDASLGGGERNRTVEIFGFLRGQIVCCVKMRRK